MIHSRQGMGVEAHTGDKKKVWRHIQGTKLGVHLKQVVAD